MSTRGVIPGSSGFPVRRLGEFAVVELPAGRGFLDAPALAGALCAVLDAGAPGLIVDLPGTAVCDSACLDALMRAARRARGWGSWLRLVIPDPGVRKVVRLVALDGGNAGARVGNRRGRGGGPGGGHGRVGRRLTAATVSAVARITGRRRAEEAR
jgi:hypothetical protein